ncbi:hypothetical protein TcCL_NonESM04047 [Trypanosoma cruzi]|nr:hypothetical protein TcCL_NonESM04047 [Trypanosoma cruzi]
MEGCPGGRRIRAHRTPGARRCRKKQKTFLVSRQTSGIESRLCAQVRCDSCPLLGRTARALRITRNPLCRWCRLFLTLKRQDHPDLLVERRAADQRRPAQATAASSRPSTVLRHTPDALALAPQSSQKTSRVDPATAPRSPQQAPHAQVTTENVKRINEQKTDNAHLHAPKTAVALQPLFCRNPHQPLSPRQSTGGTAAHAVGMSSSSTTEHPTPWRKSMLHDGVIPDGKVGRVSTESPRAINE